MNSTPQRKKVLFVCRQNRVRSTTAELVYGTRPDLEVRSAGVADYAAVPLTQEIFDWADQVFVFSKCQQEFVQGRFQSSSGNKPVVCLNLPDRFEYKSPELVRKITTKVEPYLGKPQDSYSASTSKLAASSFSTSNPFLQRSVLPLRQVAAWSMLYTIGSWLSHAVLGALKTRL